MRIRQPCRRPLQLEQCSGAQILFANLNPRDAGGKIPCDRIEQRLSRQAVRIGYVAANHVVYKT